MSSRIEGAQGCGITRGLSPLLCYKGIFPCGGMSDVDSISRSPGACCSHQIHLSKADGPGQQLRSKQLGGRLRWPGAFARPMMELPCGLVGLDWQFRVWGWLLSDP